ncbi:arylesterase [Silvimonas sp. JCM 19000]
MLLSGLSGAQAAPAPSAVILVFGDSLSAGYGLRAEQAWPPLLEARIKQSGGAARVINASVSGETTAGGLTRLPAALATHKPTLVLLELGANDGLRGLPLDKAQQNLASMIKQIQASGARVHLIGMQMPPNLGPDYVKQFAAMYSTLAAQYHTTLTPFLLAPVITRPELFQNDQLHPVAVAEPMVMEQIYKDIQPLLKPAAARSASNKKRAA